MRPSFTCNLDQEKKNMYLYFDVQVFAGDKGAVRNVPNKVLPSSREGVEHPYDTYLTYLTRLAREEKQALLFGVC